MITDHSTRTLTDHVHTQVASSGMQLFFGFTMLLGLAISFFSLSSSMYTNIRESHKEIAVLRALGVTRWQLRRAFCEEAWMVVLRYGPPPLCS